MVGRLPTMNQGFTSGIPCLDHVPQDRVKNLYRRTRRARKMTPDTGTSTPRSSISALAARPTRLVNASMINRAFFPFSFVQLSLPCLFLSSFDDRGVLCMNFFVITHITLLQNAYLRLKKFLNLKKIQKPHLKKNSFLKKNCQQVMN